FSDPEQPSAALLSSIKNYINDFETVLVSSYFDDPTKGYEFFIDVESFAKNFIVQELTKNIDADLFKSLFLVKRHDGKLEFYHVWDFDLGLGNCNYLTAHAQVSNGPQGWYIINHTQEGINTGWYCYLFRGPKFKAVVKRIWQESYPRLQQIPDFIEEKYGEIAGSAGRNFSRWSILDTYVWPNVVWLGDHRLEVDYMRDFYTDRLEWMNEEISKW
ncbi:MAG: CotH kinase family protein, partial [Bacteroidales bacterium]|nr:CotH kinase family protein [Bacteroidales bacterium]